MRTNGSHLNLHYHDGGTCHGTPTLKECTDEAVRRGWVGRVLERTDTLGSGKEVRCYSLVCGYYEHYAKQGRFVAEVRQQTVVDVFPEGI